MGYRYKIGQNVLVKGKGGGYGRVFHQDIIDGVEVYNVYIYGDEPSDGSMAVDHPRTRVNVSDLSSHTPISTAGGVYEPFDPGARARHSDGSEVKISATSTENEGERLYTGFKDGEGWGDIAECDLV